MKRLERFGKTIERKGAAKSDSTRSRICIAAGKGNIARVLCSRDAAFLLEDSSLDDHARHFGTMDQSEVVSQERPRREIPVKPRLAAGRTYHSHDHDHGHGRDHDHDHDRDHLSANQLTL